jgi:hypothetical protein
MTMFRVIHDRRGATALEFTLVLIPLFMFIFFVFDVSRYVLTWYSVSNLADEAMRKQIICYSPLIANKVKTVTCLTDPLPTAQKQIFAPALFWLTLDPPTVTTSPTDGTMSQPRDITAQVTGFKSLMCGLVPCPSTLLQRLQTVTVKVRLPF